MSILILPLPWLQVPSVKPKRKLTAFGCDFGTPPDNGGCLGIIVLAVLLGISIYWGFKITRAQTERRLAVIDTLSGALVAALN